MFVSLGQTCDPAAYLRRLTGSATLANSVVAADGTTSIVAVSEGNALTVNGNLSGGEEIDFTGSASSTLYLGGDNSGFTATFSQSGVSSTKTDLAAAGVGSRLAAWVINDGTLASSVSGTSTIHLGSLSGSGTLENDATDSTVTYEIGGNDESSAFSGIVSDGFGVVGLTKSGAGTLTLSGTSTYSGATNVYDGEMSVTGSIASSAITVSGGILTGTGSMGAVAVSGGTLSPGVGGVGTIDTGNLSLEEGSGYSVDLVDGASDKTNVIGTVSLGDASLIVNSTRAANEGDVLVLIQNDGTDAVSGTFADLPEGAEVVFGDVTYCITYVYNAEAAEPDTGNDVALVDCGEFENRGQGENRTEGRNGNLSAFTTTTNAILYWDPDKDSSNGFNGGSGIGGAKAFERAGPDRRSRRQSLQSGNLVAQLPVLRPQLLDHPQQMIYQGRSFFRRHLDVGNLDRLGSIHAPQKTPRLFSE